MHASFFHVTPFPERPILLQDLPSDAKRNATQLLLDFQHSGQAIVTTFNFEYVCARYWCGHNDHDKRHCCLY